VRPTVVVAVTLACFACVTRAHADCAKDAGELRAHLRTEHSRAEIWNAAWAILFTAAAAGQLAAAGARYNPTGDFDDAFEEQLYVGSIKATLGLLSKVVLPLKIPLPAENADACTDVAQLRKALAKAAKKERGSIWLTIIGGTVVNLTGAIWLWGRHDFNTGALSFASGVPVGPISALTQPKGSMRLYKKRRVEWTAGLGWIGGTF
jgi:hypothetical protein